MKKALIIRFNSIGDIVLTTPVIQSLSDAGYVVDYLCKSAFAEIPTANPMVRRCWSYVDNLTALVRELKKEHYDLVVDLHNNLRSRKVRSGLKAPARVLKKRPIEQFLLTRFGRRPRVSKHIVHRFLATVAREGKISSEPKLSFHINQEAEAEISRLDLPASPIAIAVGAAWQTKAIPEAKLIDVINQFVGYPIILLGGHAEKPKAIRLQQAVDNELIDLCGKVSISGSAAVIRRSLCLLTGDTGMMHIAASLGVPMVAIFGSTHPVLGYTPFYGERGKDSFSIIQNNNLNCRPCTKQGKASCPKRHFKCMNDLDTRIIIKNMQSFV